ncbi:TVP38/TMEM64 family protein [Vibrio aphrogenes]|uniref:TVP38/TMEM64 family protein n=1 Tax=Vibrio aphrogenes TaxID=1891186 RepID=UPI000B354AB2|nr:VTT domain-containing protein [Vibrio aphrogenes]
MKWLKLVLLIIIGLLLAQQLESPVMAHLTDKNWLLAYVQQHGLQGDLIILLSCVAFLAVSGPKQIIALVLGYIYPLAIALGMALLACLFAAAVNYLAARYLVGQVLFHRFPKRMSQFNQFASHKPFYKILLLRLFPIGNNVVTNLLSGSVRVPAFAFFSASLLGYFPQILIFVLMGAGIQTTSHSMIYLSIALAVISTLLTGYLYQDHLKQRLEMLTIDNANLEKPHELA